jgi:hypothetical protein
MAARTDRTRSEAWDTILQETKANTNQFGSTTKIDSKQKSQIEESLFLTIFVVVLTQGKICSARAPFRERAKRARLRRPRH